MESLSHEERLRRLRALAVANSAESRSPIERHSASRKRSAAIREYFLERTQGVCEGCNAPAPFVISEGRPYLEPHHLRRLSDGGLITRNEQQVYARTAIGACIIPRMRSASISACRMRSGK